MSLDCRDTDVQILRIDPVCGKDISVQEALTKDLFYVYEQKEHVFCSVGCLKKFIKEPRHYALEEVAGEIYICKGCRKKIHKNDNFETTMAMNGVVHKFCRPTCAAVFHIMNEVSQEWQ
ncbi:MAG: YHS domain-containing protein [Candidatus Omnitrophica bacterium]|nr:YHS domain-containing protein [Candidatus Omnitrophota bacterium]